jgi:glycosyltransferase involved in cell wall biosynthesis
MPMNTKQEIKDPCVVSVCICTYNGAARIGDVLDALDCQTDTTPRWEIVVIDNASTDETAAFVQRRFEARADGRGRLLHEAQPGQMFARRAAARAARGRFIAFLDDDNVPAPDYIERLLDVLPRHPRLGIVGGRVRPAWIGEPTPIGRAVANFALAICDRGDSPFAYRAVVEGPAGAGLVIRSDLLRAIFAEPAFAARVAGRIGGDLVGGDDIALLIRAHQLGYEVRYEPSLVIEHRIPASRTEMPYLLKLYEGIGRGQANIRPLFDAKARHPILARLIALKDAVRWARACVTGPTRAVRAEFGALAPDVHRLQRRQLYGRFRQAWANAARPAFEER